MCGEQSMLALILEGLPSAYVPALLYFIDDPFLCVRRILCLVGCSPQVAKMSMLIKTMMSEDDDSELTIPLPNVKSSVLVKVIEFCRQYTQEPMTEIEPPLKSANLADVVQEWYVKFVDVDTRPTGLGEIGNPFIGGAISNAVFKLTGKRLTHLPFTPDRVLATLKA